MPTLRPDADGDDRLAERDDHDQPVALGEVAGDELPAFGSEEVGPAHVQQQGQRPEGSLQGAARERGGYEQTHSDRGAAGQPDDHRAPQRGVVTAGHEEEQDVVDADGGVGAGEQEPGARERLRNAERHHQQAGH